MRASPDAARPLPPGPRLPAPVQTLAWLFRPIELMDECLRRYGPIFTLRLAGYPPIVTCGDPEIVRAVFTGDPKLLHAGEANLLLKPIVGANSLLLLDGDRHHAERKLLMPPFHGERMTAYGESMREVARRAIAGWPLARPFSFHEEMQAITLDIILRTVFGIAEGAAFDRIRALLKEMLAFGEHPSTLLFINPKGDVMGQGWHQRLGRLSPWGRFTLLRGQIGELLRAEIRRRRGDATTGDDVLSLLIAARDDAGQPMTEDALHDEMLTLLIAGHETTATALAWTMLRMIQNPEVREQARRRSGEGNHEYLDAVIKETLRLHPIVPLVGRRLTQPLKLGNLDLPAGVTIAPNIYAVHHRADLWPEPRAFRPQRFLNTKIPPHHYFPFGGGTRRCIGMAFALYEMRMVLAEVLATTTLELKIRYTPKMARRGITFALSDGFPVVRRTQVG